MPIIIRSGGGGFGGNAPIVVPIFNYTGNWQIIESFDENDRIRFYLRLLSSGVLTTSANADIAAFLCGGGYAGANGVYVENQANAAHGGTGGAGGRCINYSSLALAQGIEYAVTIGAAGGGNSLVQYGAETLCSSAAGVSASGGARAESVAGQVRNGSPGGASTVPIFMISPMVGLAIGGGGGGGGSGSNGGGSSGFGAGGAGGPGGGNGGRGNNVLSSSQNYSTAGASAAANTGGGGGGGGGLWQSGSASGSVSGGAGGTGIILIRWGDWSVA